MDDGTMKSILESARSVAVVGLSPKEDRPSYRVAAYLQSQGYRIIPVNPSASEVLGEKSYGSLAEIPAEVSVDVVDVFRRSEGVLSVAEQAVARGAKSLWLQEGVVNEEAAARAKAAGLNVVQDRCMLKEHRRLIAPSGF